MYGSSNTIWSPLTPIHSDSPRPETETDLERTRRGGRPSSAFEGSGGGSKDSPSNRIEGYDEARSMKHTKNRSFREHVLTSAPRNNQRSRRSVINVSQGNSARHVRTVRAATSTKSADFPRAAPRGRTTPGAENKDEKDEEDEEDEEDEHSFMKVLLVSKSRSFKCAWRFCKWNKEEKLS
ncbi:hypothetical protein HZH66_014059 [Vespula vulgaris]|uniref:Uncharacterized protein n=1 Tax=Vespula vulgaris TaxID=7454 RepID=A0A834MR78_VESVU|nr:hypothetical protein HZH66_014059 [Vespula vulgaris]